MGISWSPLSGLKGIKPPVAFGIREPLVRRQGCQVSMRVPDTLGSLEGNTEGPGTTSSETLLPSCLRSGVRSPGAVTGTTRPPRAARRSGRARASEPGVNFETRFLGSRLPFLQCSRGYGSPWGALLAWKNLA